MHGGRLERMRSTTEAQGGAPDEGDWDRDEGVSQALPDRQELGEMK
jgi:hypothetical protein